MKIPTEVRLCWDFFLGGALVSSAPTAQKCTIYLLVQQRLLHPLEVHQPRRNAPFTLLVQQRLLHPLEVHQPSKHRTNRSNHKRLCWGAWVWQGCHTLL